jgi:hypothetical protein
MSSPPPVHGGRIKGEQFSQVKPQIATKLLQNNHAKGVDPQRDERAAA